MESSLSIETASLDRVAEAVILEKTTAFRLIIPYWRIAMRTANDYYRALFGCKVYKLSLDGGFTCPNRDGRLGTGGCAFCSGSGSG